MRKKRFLLLDRIVFWLITLMTVMPSFLSAYTAIDVLAADIGTVQTSLTMDDGTASATGTVNGSGTAVDWVVTVTKYDAEDERAPKLELEYSSGLGTPYNISTNIQQINLTDIGAVTVLKGYTYSTAAETLTMTFTTDITDPISETVSIKMLAGTANEAESGTVEILSSGNTKTISLANPIAKAAAEAAAQAEAAAEAAALTEAEAAAQAAAEAAALTEAEAAAQAAAETAAQAEAEAATQAEAEAAAQAEAEATESNDNKNENVLVDSSSEEPLVTEPAEAENLEPTDTKDSPNQEEITDQEKKIEFKDYSESPISTLTNGIKSAAAFSMINDSLGLLSLDPTGGSSNVVDPTTADTDLDPGEVKITKVATPVAGKVNTWDVTLRIVGRDKRVTSDIVLVIDRSGSMASENRMQDAKTAAKLFVSTVLTADPVNTRIAIVSFAGEVTTNRNFTNIKANLDSTIESLNASGGTLTQGGMKQARDLIAGSTATKKTIILLSDGVPTYSYAINNLSQTTDFVGSWPGPYYTRSDLASARYQYTTRVGNGSSQYASTAWNNYYYSHANSAIAEAGYAKAAGTSLYTISLSAGVDGTATLEAMASLGRAYASNNASLSGIFQQIAGQLGSAASTATVTDPMASGFVINNTASIVKTSGTSAYNDVTDTLTWDFSSLTQVLPGYPEIKYEQLTYRIEISSDTPTNAASYPTNGATPISFYDVDGSYATNYFQVPAVDPVFVTVDKILLDTNNNPKSSTVPFTININLGSYNQGISITPDDPTVVLKQVWNVGTYSVTEIAATPPDRYTYQIKVNSVEQTTIALVQGGSDQNIVVTNKEKGISVTADKVWNGGPQQKPDVWLKLYRQAGIAGTVEPVPITEAAIKHLTGGVVGGSPLPEVEVSWDNVTKYDGAGTEYIYLVKEVDSSGNDYVPPGYTKEESGLTVTNTFKPSLVLTKVDIDGETPLIGAKFVIYSGDANGLSGDPIQAEQTTDATGKVTFASLEDGTYWIAETQPPSGYNWLSQPIGPFVVAQGVITGPEAYTPVQIVDDATGEFTGNYGITVENRPLTELPQAGGFGIFPFIGLGIGLMAFGIFTEKKSKKRRIVEEEKKMGKMRRFISRIVSLLMLLTVILPVMASAAETDSVTPVGGPPTPPTTTAVTIHKIVGTGGFSLRNHNGLPLTPEAIALLGTGAIENNTGVVFSVWKLSDVGGVALANGLDETEKGIIEDLDDDGLLTTNFGAPTLVNAGAIANFGSGYYYVKETTKPATLEFQLGVPFFMELPVLNAAGDTYLTALHLYPKNTIENDMPVIDKDVETKNQDDGGYDVGQNFDYLIYPKVPRGIEDYTVFKITDTLDSKLTYLDTVTVTYNGETFIPGTDYILDETLTNGFSITFTAAGLDKLAQYRPDPEDETLKDLEIKYQAEINNTAVMGTEIYNDATLDYNNGYMTTAKATVPIDNQPEVHTGGRQFIKVDNVTGNFNTALATAKFVIRNIAGEFMVKDSSTGHITWVAAQADATQLSVDGTTGAFEIKGLAYGDLGAASTYTLVEVVTPTGYVTMNPVDFTIDATTYTNTTVTISPLPIRNVKRPMIPQTGGMGTILFTVAGLAMMTVSVVALKKKEEA
ncbi:SpaH/EbpB family LPXTG-anchored major pilin [Trichococcus shcherbakoviae]|uniref:Gram-positive anchor n=1 Tax=Trichococcus shcherbakoviae TaxID=2094020 RepID=A0A383TFF7_9LACT|nr:SpaH/EbpB family LPXTG-anchored major pilin [Trichococcus shcherbakoviae]SYZ79033.1 gram-positive anchor [Trichococcus shcherbakoviae]